MKYVIHLLAPFFFATMISCQNDKGKESPPNKNTQNKVESHNTKPACELQGVAIQDEEMKILLTSLGPSNPKPKVNKTLLEIKSVFIQRTNDKKEKYEKNKYIAEKLFLLLDKKSPCYRSDNKIQLNAIDTIISSGVPSVAGKFFELDIISHPIDEKDEMSLKGLRKIFFENEIKGDSKHSNYLREEKLRNYPLVLDIVLSLNWNEEVFIEKLYPTVEDLIFKELYRNKIGEQRELSWYVSDRSKGSQFFISHPDLVKGVLPKYFNLLEKALGSPYLRNYDLSSEESNFHLPSEISYNIYYILDGFNKRGDKISLAKEQREHLLQTMDFLKHIRMTNDYGIKYFSSNKVLDSSSFYDDGRHVFYLASNIKNKIRRYEAIIVTHIALRKLLVANTPTGVSNNAKLLIRAEDAKAKNISVGSFFTRKPKEPQVYMVVTAKPLIRITMKDFCEFNRCELSSDPIYVSESFPASTFNVNVEIPFSKINDRIELDFEKEYSIVMKQVNSLRNPGYALTFNLYRDRRDFISPKDLLLSYSLEVGSLPVDEKKYSSDSQKRFFETGSNLDISVQLKNK